MSIIRSNPWRFDAEGEGTADFLSTYDLYGAVLHTVRPRIRKIRMTSVTGGNINITTGDVDPTILYNATLAANADVTLDFGEGVRVRGVFIEDIPADGLVEVWRD